MIFFEACKFLELNMYLHISIHLDALFALCGKNCYFKRSNNPQDWSDGWTTLVPLNNDLLISIII